MWRRFSCAYDPHSIFVWKIGIGVDDNKNEDKANEADGMPPLFAVFETVRHDEMKRIVPNLSREIEPDPMFDKIFSRLLEIPNELHSRSIPSFVRTKM